jgi:hypothetical protein
MAFEDIDTRQLESIAHSIERMAQTLEGVEPEECNSIECIVHALESIAKSMDPNFKPLYDIRSDFTDSVREVREAHEKALIVKRLLNDPN